MNAIESRRMRSKGQSGFTLIELLVVIAILGILAGVVVFAVGGVTSSAKNNACKVEVKTIQTAIAAYRSDNNEVFPATLAVLKSGTTPYLGQDPTLNFTYTTVGTPITSASLTAIPAGSKYASLSAAEKTACIA